MSRHDANHMGPGRALCPDQISRHAKAEIQLESRLKTECSWNLGQNRFRKLDKGQNEQKKNIAKGGVCKSVLGGF